MTNPSEDTSQSAAVVHRPLVWCEVDDQALVENVAAFRTLIGPDVILSVAVKANAYGHGIVETSRAFIEGGADWLCVQTIDEAQVIRDAGIQAPIYVVGPVALYDLKRASELGVRMVVYTAETVDELRRLGCAMKLHIKIETGNHRQGISAAEALELAQQIADCPSLALEGVCSHFANIEDTTDHTYARHQLAVFDEAVRALEAAGHRIELRHLSNSAATILWPDQKFEMVRIGISAYGLWPSPETQLAAAVAADRYVHLRPALTLKAQIVQLKSVAEGASIGYGCTYVTTHQSLIAVLGVGYFDGYDRKLSNVAYGLCRGRRAPVRGRVCMNMMMVDVTHIPDVRLGDEVTLLGRDGGGSISAEQVAQWASTISYEIVSRIGGHLPRVRIRTDADTHSLDKVYRPPVTAD